jgi:hypothetical protein
MELKPIKSCNEPAYPTQEHLRQEPQLLSEPPRRWKGNRAVLGALAGAIALMNQACATHHHFARLGGAVLPSRVTPEDEAKARAEQGHGGTGKEVKPARALR